MTPKCLLPVGNRPLLFYALYSLERSGLSEAILVTTERALERVTSYVEEIYGVDPAVIALRSAQATQRELAVHIESVPDDLDSGEAVLAVAKHLDADDVLILSADAFGYWDLATLMATHRVSDAVWTMSLTSAKSNKKGASGTRNQVHSGGLALESTTIATPPRDYFLVDESTQRLLYIKPCADTSSSADRLRLPRDVLRAEGPMMIHRDLLDLHIYVCRRWVLELLRSRRHMANIRSDLLPYLVRNQFVMERRLSRAWSAEATAAEDSALRNAWHRYIDRRSGDSAIARALSRDRNGIERDRSWIPKLPPPPLHAMMNQRSQASAAALPLPSIRCQACFTAPERGRLFRVNTIDAYIEANRLVAAGILFGELQSVTSKGSTRGHEETKVVTTVFDAACSDEIPASGSERTTAARIHVGKDCLVASEGIHFGRGCTVKNQTVIGAHTALGANCKISACVIMDHVRIGNSCILQNCVIGSNAQIHDQCQLRNCLIGPDAEISARTHQADEVFSRTDIPLTDSYMT
jgi:translation initiation factor eIF-2B subunit gamma